MTDGGQRGDLNIALPVLAPLVAPNGAICGGLASAYGNRSQYTKRTHMTQW